MNGFEKLIGECDDNLLFYTEALEILRNKIACEEKIDNDLSKIQGNQRSADWEEMKQFDAYSGYIVIGILDLSVNLKNLVLAKTDWEKAYCIKQAYLTIFETLQHLKPPKELPNIQQFIERNYAELKPQLEELLAKISSFRQTPGYKKILMTRHNAAAHINKNLKVFYDTLLKLDGEEAAQQIIAFNNILKSALEFTKDYSVLANRKLLEQHGDIKEKAIDAMTDLFKLMKKNNL